MATWRLWTQSDLARVTPAGDWPEATSGYDRVPGSKLPRNHHHRAYRLTAGAEVLAVVGVAYRRSREVLEASGYLFTPADTAVVEEVLRFVLTDAYRCSGFCAVRFTRPADRAESARLAAVHRVTEARGVTLPGWNEWAIGSDEGRELYLALTGLSANAREVAETLDRDGRGRAETVCFLVQNGLWSAAEVDGLLLGCPYPDAVFAGGAPPTDRHLARIALYHARLAVLTGRLHQFLTWGGPAAVEPSVTEPAAAHRCARQVTARSPAPGARSYTSPVAIPLRGWSRSPDRTELPVGKELIVVPVVAERADLASVWAVAVDAVRAAVSGNALPFVAAPADFDQLPAPERDALIASAGEKGVGVLAAPDTFAQLTLEARRRLSYSRTVRR